MLPWHMVTLNLYENQYLFKKNKPEDLLKKIFFLKGKVSHGKEKQRE